MYRHIIDRSNLDEVVAIVSQKKRSITRRESLMENDIHRGDIVLFNATRSGREYVLYVGENGFVGDEWLLDLLNDDEYDQVQRIAKKMRYNAREFPPAKKLIY